MRSPRLRVAPSVGSLTLVVVAFGSLALWFGARPQHQPTGRFVGEICGAEAVLLLSCSLVLATVLPPIERAFSGLDRVAVWHKRVATGAVLLLAPHLVLVTSPPDAYATTFGHALGDVALLGLLVLSVWALAPKLRAARWPGPIRRLARTSYERWLTAHRLTGVFVAVAVAHGALVDPVLHHSATLRVSFLVVGGIGVAAYLYREFLARFVIPIHDYLVAEVRRPIDTVVEVSLEPVRAQLRFDPGQFVFLAFGGVGAWQRHPFSVASAPSQRMLDVSVKAVGDYTRDLRMKLKAGTPAKVAGPFGGFDFRSRRSAPSPRPPSDRRPRAKAPDTSPTLIAVFIGVDHLSSSVQTSFAQDCVLDAFSPRLGSNDTRPHETTPGPHQHSVLRPIRRRQPHG
jgi:predicted ferric reductase